MPLVIQLPEVSDRNRRFLGLRGRTPFALDETIVPVVLQADVSQPPYRQEGLSGDMQVTKAAVVAEFSYVFWGPHLRACTLVVDEITISNTNAAATAMHMGYQQTIGGVAQPTTAFSGEMPAVGGSPPVARCAWGMDSGDDALELIGLEIFRISFAGLEVKTFRGPWVVQPSQNMVARADLVNQALRVMVKARQFQLLQP